MTSELRPASAVLACGNIGPARPVTRAVAEFRAGQAEKEASYGIRYSLLSQGLQERVFIMTAVLLRPGEDQWMCAHQPQPVSRTLSVLHCEQMTATFECRLFVWISPHSVHVSFGRCLFACEILETYMIKRNVHCAYDLKQVYVTLKVSLAFLSEPRA